jgi:hypothetical protein
MKAKSALWPGRWINPVQPGPLPQFHAYRLDFTCAKAEQASLLVTADQRYILWLDGAELGRGPERGDLRNWFCNSYTVQLSSGKHRLVAFVWSVPTEMGNAPRAQLSLSPGFYLTAESPLNETLTTGLAKWETASVPGVSSIPGVMHGATNLAGGLFSFDGATWPRELSRGEGLSWALAPNGSLACEAPSNNAWGSADERMLTRPALAAQINQPLTGGRVRHLDDPGTADPETVRVTSANCLKDELAAWQHWIDGKGSLKLPPHTCRRAIIDLENYACAYSRTAVNGGTGGSLSVSWSESLFVKFDYDGIKENRSEIENKIFVGRGDRLALTGSGSQVLETLWWNAGRYIEILVTSGETELTLESFTLRETRYPFEREDSCEVPLSDWKKLHQIMWRSLQMCSHETYMDCPFYEQLQYAGDTRLQMLTCYVSSHDARLPAKTLRMFSSSLGADGLTASAYPAGGKQIIPQFSLFWVAMLHDHLFWRGDEDLIRLLLPNTRRVMDTFLQLIDKDGALHWPAGWNWVDWAEAWRNAPTIAGGGHSVLDDTELSGINALQFIYVAGLIAEVEELVGEPVFAQRYREARMQVMQAARHLYWDKSRGLFADTPSKNSFSEHAQCYAILSGLLSPDEKKQIARSLGKDTSLALATIYFQHYLFESFTALGCTERILDGLGVWRDLARQGFVTTIERPDPSRSDCHAWGAHPIYHLYASLLGIRPTTPGFKTVGVRPQLGGLPQLKARIPHPAGWIEAEIAMNGSKAKGSVTLPEGVTGVFHGHSGSVALVSGLNQISD